MKGSVSLEAGSAQVSGTFAESIVRGRVSALDMSMFITQSGQNVAMRMLLVNGHFYLGGNAVLAALNVRDKRWALLSQDSANPRLAQLADQLSPYLAAVSGDQYGSYAGAAASIQDVGRQQLGGASARKYLVTVDVAKLARMTTGVSRSAAQRIAASGVRTLPMTLWLADSGRLLQVELSSTANGATSHTRYRVTGYNVAVRIRQPADDDVYTG